MWTGRKLTIESSDGETFQVDEAVALKSQLINRMIEEEGKACSTNNFIMKMVTGKILAKVIEYCKKHVDHDNLTTLDDSEIKIWDAEFVICDRATLFGLLCAADYMEIKGLLDLTCQRVADLIKGKTPEQVCNIFKIKMDHLPEGLHKDLDRMDHDRTSYDIGKTVIFFKE